MSGDNNTELHEIAAESPPSPSSTWDTGTLVDRLRWPIALLGSVGLLSFTAHQLWDRSHGVVEGGMQHSANLASATVQQLSSIAQRFQTGNITQTFTASLPSIKGSGSGRLELASLDVTETFRSEDNLRIWWDHVSLGTTVSEISVPVTYRYHLKLDADWKLSVSNQTCLVTAPRIRPTLPPSIHTGRMKKTTQNGWARFNADEQLDHLEKGLTANLVQYAEAEDRLLIVREQARKTVANFVKNWLLREEHWRDDRFHSVIVRFSDEPETKPLPEPHVEVELEFSTE